MDRKERIKETVIAAALIFGLIAAWIAFWRLLASFMWACHDAGIPM